MGHTRSLAMTFLVVWCAGLAAAGEPVTIPLKDVWAYKMPGTRPMIAGMNQPVEGGPLRHASEESPLVEEIRRKLRQRVVNGIPQPASSGFVVRGDGMTALRNAHRILVGDGKRSGAFPPDAQLTLVFFSYDFGAYVELIGVQREDEIIRINYKFVPHRSADTTQHLALIPLGHLPRGVYHVILSHTPISKRILKGGDTSARWEKNYISQPFSFRVEPKSRDSDLRSLK